MCCRLVLPCSHLYCFSSVGLKIQFSPCFLHVSGALSFHSVTKWSGPAIPSKTLIVLLQVRSLHKGRMYTADSRYFFTVCGLCLLTALFLLRQRFPNGLKENCFILCKTGSCFVIFLEICVPFCLEKLYSAYHVSVLQSLIHCQQQHVPHSIPRVFSQCCWQFYLCLGWAVGCCLILSLVCLEILYSLQT